MVEDCNYIVEEQKNLGRKGPRRDLSLLHIVFSLEGGGEEVLHGVDGVHVDNGLVVLVHDLLELQHAFQKKSGVGPLFSSHELLRRFIGRPDSGLKKCHLVVIAD